MKTAHLICNAHIDPIWQWEWQEGVSAVLSTFQSAVRLAEEFDYIFCHNEVTVYKYVEEYAPALFEKIRQLVNEGKWHIMGGWYLQPDCNMPSGESFVRQILTARRYFLEKFGTWATTAINFDPFGHTSGLVQIIKKCGQDSYIFCRPYASEETLPAEQFIWEGPDGSRIKALRAIDGYNTPLGNAAPVIADRIARQKGDVGCVLWGVGNHGGGPSRKDLADIQTLMEESPVKIVHSTPEAFFRDIEPEAVVKNSLRISMPGCYTSMCRVKQKHIELENELYLTEKMLSVAALRGLIKYPQAKLDTVVEDLLNAEFHDVLPGSCIRAGEENGLKLLDHGLLEIERLKTSAFFALCKTEDPAKEGEIPILVFNPNAYEFQTDIECEFMLPDQNWSENTAQVFVEDDKGNRLPCQTIKEKSNISLDWRKRIIFSCTLAPLSLNRFSVFLDYKKTEKVGVKQNLVLEDDEKYIEIDADTGLLKSYRVEGVEYLKYACQPVLFQDNADPWAMQHFQQSRLGTNGKPFALIKEPYGVFKGMKSIQTVENGKILLRTEAFFERENTKARVEYTFYHKRTYFDVRLDIFPGDVDCFVKLALPVGIRGELKGQTAFGSEKLFADARENVCGRFIAVKGQKKCLAVFNDCIYGSHFEDDTLYLSLLRGVSYCAHPILDRPIIPSDRFVEKIDQGERNFHFRIAVVAEDELERLAQEFNQKPYALSAFPIAYREKALPLSIAVANRNITLVAMKKGEETGGYILRLLNNSPESVQTELSVNDEKILLSFGKYEVKTVVYDKDLRESHNLLI